MRRDAPLTAGSAVGAASALIAPALAGGGAILLSLAPVAAGPSTSASPHLVFVALAFWAVRRPDSASPLLIFAVGLAYEATRAGPIGVETFALLAALGLARLWSEAGTPRSFGAEMARVAAAAGVLEATSWALMAAALAPGPSLADHAWRWALSVAAYPVAAAALSAVFGVRRTEPSLAERLAREAQR